MEKKIKEILDKIRPALEADGGDVEFINWDDKEGILKVRLVGACAHCPMSQMTLKAGIENTIKKEIPAVKEVISE